MFPKGGLDFWECREDLYSEFYTHAEEKIKLARLEAEMRERQREEQLLSSFNDLMLPDSKRGNGALTGFLGDPASVSTCDSLQAAASIIGQMETRVFGADEQELERLTRQARAAHTMRMQQPEMRVQLVLSEYKRLYLAGELRPTNQRLLKIIETSLRSSPTLLVNVHAMDAVSVTSIYPAWSRASWTWRDTNLLILPSFALQNASLWDYVRDFIELPEAYPESVQETLAAIYKDNPHQGTLSSKLESAELLNP